ncbi:g/t mismatch-specific thymine DNA glycosylase [Anaeramoeba flamelloides]|uniref:G/t mismatch-specific thymine DNA glycosylase n=1 Tax=Anaeramoeba flamelloides TaxID=1746091 RepID=A0AAV8A725_9EUKA|nr:g/t mismatch-specific thymine DNA glycosylase [Anaeramoeba flamelloides]
MDKTNEKKNSLENKKELTQESIEQTKPKVKEQNKEDLGGERKRKQPNELSTKEEKQTLKKKIEQGSTTKVPLSHPFAPIVDKDCETLILGTFPSIKSFENTFYYGHPRNVFWKILSELFCEDLTKYKTKNDLNQARRKMVLDHHIAIWDCIGVAKRKKSNSLDSSLVTQRPNEIPKLLRSHPNLQTLCFTSRNAQNLFKKHFPLINLKQHVFPSPSPAYQRMNYEQKRDGFKKILQKIGLIESSSLNSRSRSKFVNTDTNSNEKRLKQKSIMDFFPKNKNKKK